MTHSINALLLTPATDAPARHNFARTAESLAQAKTPGFASYLAPDAPTQTASLHTDTTAANVTASDSNFTLGDTWDTLNPLQHIPILSALTRDVTDSPIKPVAQVAGDVLYGSFIGTPFLSTAASVASATSQSQNGQDPIAQVADALFGTPVPPPESPPAPIAVASAAESSVPPASPPPDAAPNPPPAAEAEAAAATPPAPSAPYGGVMASTSTKPANPVAAVSAPRMGNIIYANPKYTAAARTAALQAAQIPQAIDPASAPAASSASLALPGAPGKTDSKTLGQMMHAQAQSSAQGNQIPSNLVQDMMMMALDKYKTAAGMSPSQLNTGAPN